MTDEQERILLHCLDKVYEAGITACTREEVEETMDRVVRYVRTLVDGTHFLSADPPEPGKPLSGYGQ